MLPSFRSKSLIALLIVVLTLGGLPAASAMADGGPIVTPHGDPLASIYGGVRFRSFASNISTLEVFQGSNLNPPPPYETLVTQNLTWIRPGMNSITFTYDDVEHKLISVVNDNPPLVFAEFYPSGPINYMRLVVVERDTGSKVDFKHVRLDGYNLGNFATKTPRPQEGCYTPAGAPPNSWCSWKVTGYDMTDGFTLTGDIKLVGDFPSTNPETSKVEIVVGYLPPAP